MKKVLILILVLTIILNSTFLPVFASEAHSEKEAKTEKVHTSEHEEHAKVPFLLYLQWISILLIFGIASQYTFQWIKGRVSHKNGLRAYILTILVLIVISLNYHPEIKHFHEPPAISFIKFLFAVGSGALLTLYGVLGRHDEHEEESHGGER